MYIGSCSGSFHALDRRDGRPVWTHETSLDGDIANFHGNVLFADDLVVVGGDTEGDAHLYAFDAATGEVRWKQSAPGGFPSDVVRHGSRALAVAMSGEVWCVDLETGRSVWRYGGAEGERLLRSSILTIDRRVLVSLPSGEVLALEAESGERIWETDLKSRLNTSLAVIDEAVYVGDRDGRIHRLALEDGRELAAFEAESPAYGTLLPAGGCLLALLAEDTLACLEPDLQKIRWSRKTTSAWSSFHPLVLNGRVVAGTESGEIEALNLSDGTPAWTRKLEGEIKGLGASGDVLYVGTLQGRVYALPLP